MIDSHRLGSREGTMDGDPTGRSAVWGGAALGLLIGAAAGAANGSPAAGAGIGVAVGLAAGVGANLLAQGGDALLDRTDRDR